MKRLHNGEGYGSYRGQGVDSDGDPLFGRLAQLRGTDTIVKAKFDGERGWNSYPIADFDIRQEREDDD